MALKRNGWAKNRDFIARRNVNGIQRALKLRLYAIFYSTLHATGRPSEASWSSLIVTFSNFHLWPDCRFIVPAFGIVSYHCFSEFLDGNEMTTRLWNCWMKSESAKSRTNPGPHRRSPRHRSQYQRFHCTNSLSDFNKFGPAIDCKGDRVLNLSNSPTSFKQYTRS